MNSPILAEPGRLPRLPRVLTAVRPVPPLDGRGVHRPAHRRPFQAPLSPEDQPTRDGDAAVVLPLLGDRGIGQPGRPPALRPDRPPTRPGPAVGPAIGVPDAGSIAGAEAGDASLVIRRAEAPAARPSTGATTSSAFSIGRAPGTTARISRCSGSGATWSHQSPLGSSAGPSGSPCVRSWATKDHFSSDWTSRVRGEKPRAPRGPAGRARPRRGPGARRCRGGRRRGVRSGGGHRPRPGAPGPRRRFPRGGGRDPAAGPSARRRGRGRRGSKAVGTAWACRGGRGPRGGRRHAGRRASSRGPGSRTARGRPGSRRAWDARTGGDRRRGAENVTHPTSNPSQWFN